MDIQGVQFPAMLSQSVWKRRFDIILGRLLATLWPARAQRVENGQLPERLGLPDRWLIAAMVDRHQRAGNLGALAPLHQWLWRSTQAVSFHEQACARYASWWLHHHVAIVEPIKALLQQPGIRYDQLCEIGCGSGLVLRDLARRLPQLEQLTGLDLSPQQTELNRERRADTRIRFEAGDALDWIPAHPHPGTIYLTVAGVFEYFAAADLEKLFAQMAQQQSPVAVALIEPVPADYDFEREQRSRPYGAEHSLGHNYPRMLKAAGFTIRYEQLQTLASIRFLLLVAEHRGTPPSRDLHTAA